MSESMSELSRRRLLQLSAVSGAGLLLAACDVGGGNDSGASGDRGAAGTGEGQIKALFMKQAGYSEDDIRAMTDEFQKKYPKITIEPSFVAYEALHDKIVAAAPASTFDVVLIDVIWPAEFGSKRIVTDVTDQFPAAWKSDMLGGALATAAYRDRYFGVPWILDTKYFFYNTDMLSRAGVAPASLSTWEGVLAAARTLKAKKVVDYPLIWSWKQAEALICDYTQLVGAFGGKFLSDDGGSVAFNTGGGLQALEFMKMTLDTKLTNPNSVESLEEDVRKIFSDGQAAMALNWTYMFNAANDPQQSKVVGKVGVAATPAGPASAPGVNGSMALSVSSGSKNQKAAWTYVSYITSADVQNKYAKSSLPCWTKSYDDSAVVSALPQVVPVARKQLANLIARPQVPRYNEISQILQAEVQNALLGRKPAKKALDDAAEQARSLLS
ncbi:extracellular solute-binding protein [Micromonospora inositola]|uniref:Carbohydrate ABC transporter substrate-binding protein, CUT1 family n=1 Tax=Micromonospora inositola TaxID=47865 RepID=A0A1C5JRR7_9ACTN|nr:extracellular solute-binding protein [Micromonospora inositola]SCG73295.1 carbohydrate ABC transporter substrate-binding protein, CUT1 family [Micromonospora inositola]